ncbi:hypothetical protein HNY73_002219 [Argiope bruennichi]|uniref:C2H2-type domain-containing protein n=1 Tax=Argiope bruennichi TaxID=94029 RepID=A0A8T0FVI4_ARGBR|nr:hypothetical protein HNY73_002219 [Argiope bruennichi]
MMMKRILLSSLCEKRFNLKSNVKKQERIIHRTKSHECVKCKMTFTSICNLKRHSELHDDDRRRKRQRQNSSSQPDPSSLQTDGATPSRPVSRSRSAFNAFETIKIYPSAAVLKDLELFLLECESETIEIIERRTREERGTKFYLGAKIRFVRNVIETELEFCESYFRSKCVTFLLNEPAEEKVKHGFEKIKTSCEEFGDRDSGWVIDEILFLEVNTCLYHPLSASTCIPLSPFIAKKMVVINIRNSDAKCFL